MKNLSIIMAVLLVSVFCFAASAEDVDDLFGDDESGDEESDVEDAEGEFDDDEGEDEEDEDDLDADDEGGFDEPEEEEEEEDKGPPPDFKYHRIGAILGGGLGLQVGNHFDATKPKFVFGFDLTYDYYFNENFALALGLGFVGKGTQHSDAAKTKLRTGLTYLEVPLGVKIAVANFQIGVGVALDLALKGKTKDKKTDVEADWSDNSAWDDFYGRFNLPAKVFIGYEIEAGPLTLVPGVDWSLQMLNNSKVGSQKSRLMNILFCFGAQFGL